MNDRDTWSLDACIARGCLPTGEPLEAAFGVGPWTHQPEREPELVECPSCHEPAYCMNDQIQCPNCGTIS